MGYNLLKIGDRNVEEKRQREMPVFCHRAG